MHRFTNYKFEIFLFGDKFLWNWFEWSYYIDHSQYKIEKFEPKKSIYRNFKHYDSDQFKLNNCNRMSTMRTHSAFENNFFSILDKQKFYERIKKSILIITFGSK